MFLNFLRKFIAPLSWTVISQILLCIPGTDLPDTGGFFKIPHLDKVVHCIIYSGIVFFWSFYLYSQRRPFSYLKKWFFIIFLLAAGNGILIEYIQFYFVPDRSFDVGDIVADLIAASVTYGICNITMLKINR